MKAMNGVVYYEAAERQGEKKHPTVRLSSMGHRLRTRQQPASGVYPLLTGFQELRLFKRTVSRSGLVARLYSDWVENAETARKFWTLVLSESAPDPDDETRSFAEQLKKMNADRKKVTQEEFFKEAAKAWKRFKRTLDRTENVAA